MADFAERLKTLRKQRGLRQKDLAHLLGLAQTTIANYEQNTRFPDERTLHKIADYFNITLDYLLGRIDTNIDPQIYRSSHTRDKAESESLEPMTPLAKRYMDLLLRGSREEASKLVRDAVHSLESIKKIYRDIFERTLKEIGKLWSEKRIDIAQEHYFSHSTQLIMSQLYPDITSLSKEKNGSSCLAFAICGEAHQIGVRMVADFLEMEGWSTYFLGSNVCYQDILNAIDDYRADLLAVSVTMKFGVESAARLVQVLQSHDRGSRVKIMIGGQAFDHDPGLWRMIGASGYAENAEEAVQVADGLMRRRVA